MSKGLGILLIAVLLVVVMGGTIFLTAIGVKNGLVSRDEAINEAWAQVETVLQRRYDLIPNLVNTVKGYAQQERTVLEEVTRLRSQWGEAKTLEQRTSAANGLEGALARLMVVVERYPELKSNQNFLALQDELAGTENRIAVERRRYNEAVRAYNTAVRKFPASLFAAHYGFAVRDVYFQSVEPAKQAPQVNF